MKYNQTVADNVLEKTTNEKTKQKKNSFEGKNERKCLISLCLFEFIISSLLRWLGLMSASQTYKYMFIVFPMVSIWK